jgi:hypothetical protein
MPQPMMNDHASMLSGNGTRSPPGDHRLTATGRCPMRDPREHGDGACPSRLSWTCTGRRWSVNRPKTCHLKGASTRPRKTILFTAVVLATLALMLAGHGESPAIAGTATPNVAGTSEGTWSHRIGSVQITLRLA